MDFIAILSFSIMVIIILTLIFGIIAYFLYKIREKQRKTNNDTISYQDLRDSSSRKYLYFDEAKL